MCYFYNITEGLPLYLLVTSLSYIQKIATITQKSPYNQTFLPMQQHLHTIMVKKLYTLWIEFPAHTRKGLKTLTGLIWCPVIINGSFV